MTPFGKRTFRTASMFCLLYLATATAYTADFDIVLTGGRVMNPESGLDSVRNVGIRDGQIAALSREPLTGPLVIDVSGLVIAPGFIDLHAHGQHEFASRLQALDGVTTQLEMEVGVYPVAEWYENRQSTAIINFGATVGHMDIRMIAMTDLSKYGLTEEDFKRVAGKVELESEIFRTLTKERQWVDGHPDQKQMSDLLSRAQEGIDEGALGIGFGIEYTPGATREEIFRLFKVAKTNGLTNFVHARSSDIGELGGAVDSVQELIANAASTGAGVHIVHIVSTGANQVDLLLEMVDKARDNGVSITTEVYPYTAWSSFIGAAFFDEGWTSSLNMKYSDIELPATGERLNKDSFLRIRSERPDTTVVGHGMKETNVTAAVAHPGVMIASDGMVFIDGRAHPRGAGTFSRVLGHYVREKGVLSLMEALGKMSYLPARLLEDSVPQMRTKGRIAEGADADIVILDPEKVIDRATFTDPATPSDGIEHVLVSGQFIVRDGGLIENFYPGQAIRRPH